jgi:hypothetical protein
MDSAFYEIVWLVPGLSRGRGHFLIFCCCSMIYDAKSAFLAVNASLRYLNNVGGVYLVQVSLLFIGQQGLGYSFRYRPSLPIGWRIVQLFTPTQDENDQYSANHSQCKTSSKPIHFYQRTIILHSNINWH